MFMYKGIVNLMFVVYLAALCVRIYWLSIKLFEFLMLMKYYYLFIILNYLDVYLLGIVMLVFGMGFYEFFISNFDKAESILEGLDMYSLNLFGLFILKVCLKFFNNFYNLFFFFSFFIYM